MTNGERYKTAKERTEAFDAFCGSHISRCDECPIEKSCDDGGNTFAWLELEAEEEKPLPCPFCGSECEVGLGRVFCTIQSCYCSKGFDTNEEAIAAHNRVARAVMAANEKEKEAK